MRRDEPVIQCEHCEHSLTCMELVPCERFTDIPRTNFTTDVIELPDRTAIRLMSMA